MLYEIHTKLKTIHIVVLETTLRHTNLRCYQGPHIEGIVELWGISKNWEKEKTIIFFYKKDHFWGAFRVIE